MRKVNCVRHQAEKPGLEEPPFPGEMGRFIFDNVCADAWQEWIAHQTRLINEQQLSLMDEQSKDYLLEQMQKYFSGQEFDTASGYLPT